MKNRAFRKFVASIGVAAMVMSTATNAMSPAVTRAESAQELEGQQNDSQEQGGQEDPVAQSSDDTNGAPFADAEPMAVSSEDSQNSQEAAGPSESSGSNGENGPEGSSGENTNASAGSTSTDASGAGSQDATGTMSGATNGTAGTMSGTITETTENRGTINGATDTSANGTSTDASTGTTTEENGEASGDNAEASTKEITSVITEDIDLGTYPAGEAPAYAQLELPDEIEVKVDEEKQTVTVTWNGEETYHPDQAGTYIFSSELDKEWNKDENGNARYQLAEKVELPKASVRVEKKAESTEDSKAEVKSDNKTENKTDAKLDIKEDKKTDAKADNKSEGKTEEKSDNKSEVTTKPETTKATTKDTSKENTKETSKKDSASKDKTKDETKNETKGEAKNEAKEENKTDTKDETAKADQKKKVTNAASLKAVYVAEDGTILCGTVGLTGDSFTISDKAKSFNGYELKTVTLGEEELPQDTVFTRNTSTTETKEEIRTEASYTYTMDGAEHEIAAGDTATITFTYAQKEEVTPEIASIEVTGEAVDTTGAAIQGDYAFPLAVGTNDLSKTAPYIQGYEYQYAEIGTDKITSIAKEVLEAGKYAYYVDGELLKENTRITYVYQEDEDYTEQLSADCGDVSVTLSATKDAKIPKNAKLVVNAITGDRLRSALSMSADAMGVTADKVYGTAYDIYLEADGNRIQPSEHVHVTMSFHNPVSLNLPDKAQVAKSAVIHIHDGSASEISGTAGTDGSSVTGAEFDADSFSIYVNAYTVDFHYNGLTYSMKGNGAVKLSEVMKAVDIQKDVAEVKSAIFTNPELLKVEKDTEGNDWTLTSLQSFTSDEILTVTMEDGTVYAIAVTDSEEASGTEDISGLISKVELYQEGSSTPEQGTKWNVKANTDYTIRVEFSEEPNNTQKQFPSSGKMHYQLPGNISISNHKGTGTIGASDAQGKFSLPYSYSIDANGKITITLDSSHGDYQRFQSCGNASLYVDLSAKFTASGSNQISFGPVTKTVNVDSKANLAVTKSGTYDPKTNKTTYTVTVTSTGYNENVEVQDTITGSLLTFDGIESITASSTRTKDNSLSNIVKEKQGNGFKVKIPSMKDGETITLNYTASVALAELNGNSTGDSEAETGNKVSVKHTNDEKPQQEKEFHHSVSAYTSISKNVGQKGIGQVQSENVNGKTRYYRVIPWTIEYNKDRYVSVAGNTITDTITTTTPPMSYTGKGIEIQITNEDGTKGEIRNVSWENLQANGSVSGWQYKIPETDGRFGYTITYNTKVDVTDIITSQTVKNDVSDGKGHTAHGAPSVGPRDENKAGLTKTGIKEGDKARWTITITVPADGLSKAELVDELPQSYNGSVDQYANDLEMTGAPEGTSMVVSMLDKDGNETSDCAKAVKIKVEFYRNTEKSERGIAGNGQSTSQVQITLRTKFNENWQEGQKEHINKVTLNNIFTAQAPVNPEASSVKKTLKKVQTIQLRDGSTTQAYYFDITFENIYDSKLSFCDNYDKNYLKLLTPDVYQGYQWSEAGLYIGNASYDGRIMCPDNFKSTETGFSFEYDGLNFDETNNPMGNYKVTYALYVDPNKIDDLNARAALTSGKYKFSNSMESSAGSSGVSFDYTHPTLSKTDTVTKAEDQKSATAHFKIIANPEGFEMNGRQNLTLTDKIIKNLSIDYSSIKVDPEGALVKYTSSGDTITFIIKDKQMVTITYDAKVLAPGEFSNSATLQGETVTRTNSVNFTNSSGGTASNPSIRIIKVDQDNEAIKLKGAEFGLYTDPKATQPVQYPEQNNENAVFVTDSNGEATIIGDANTKGWTLEKNKTYYLKELNAPAGYEKNTTIYQFTISSTNQPNHLKYIYYDGDELTVKDKKISTSADLKVKKEVSGEGYAANEDFSFSLSPESSNAPMPEGSASGSKTVSVKNNGEANFGTIHYTEEGTYKYKIKESAGTTPGMSYDSAEHSVTVTVSKNKETGALEAAVDYGKKDATELTVTNTYSRASADLKVKKVVSGEGYAANEDFSFSLSPESSNAPMPEGSASGSKTVSVKNNGEANFGTIHYTEEGTYKYKIKESAGTTPGMSYDSAEHSVTVTVSKNKETGALEAAVDYGKKDATELTITNTYTPEKVQVSGSKNWNDDGNAAGTRPGSITIRLYANGSEIDHKTVTEKDGWSWNWTGLNRYGADHKEISYTISEDAVDGYTSSISGYNVTNTVNKPQVGSVILTKVDAMTGTALAGAVFDLYRANNTKVGTYTTNAGGVLRVDGLTFGDYYFVETKAPEGYALESQRAAFTINAATTVSAPASVRVTNKPVDEKIGVSAAKVWDDENNTDGVRPSSVTFRLFADGVEIGSAQASEANGWTVSFGNLPKTRNGVAISYAVKEDEVGNYYEASYETGLGSDGSYVFTVKNYRETDKHYEERTGSVRGANRNKPSNGGVAGAGRGRGTGDESDMTVYGTVSGASLLALIVWMIARRKRAGKGTK